MDDNRLVKEEDKKEKNKYSRDQDQDQNSPKPAVMKVRNGEDETCKPSSWKQKDFCSTKKEDLESTKAEMGQVMEENKRLKSDLDQIMNDYQSLQMRFHEFTRNQQESKTLLEGAKNNNIDPNPPQPEVEDTHELSLSLGRNPSLDSSKNKSTCSELNLTTQETLKQRSSSGLSLALDYKDKSVSKPATDTPMMDNTSTENSLDEAKDEAGETWPPSKVLKTMKSGGRDEDVVQQPPVKKARVSVRARCDTPTMNDGCQWRKYGQKIAKGNPCPRAYYRCTVAPSCPVRKQVQRCADDMSILITTYEGTHNHPLPISATAMASTTSAAAYMLISGSSTSNSGVGSSTSSTTTSTNLNSNSNFNSPGLNFNMTDTSRSRPIYFPNSSFSPSPSQPTITLDLTASSTSSASTSSQFSKLASTNFAPRTYPTTTNLTFNSLDLSNPNPNGNNLPMSWPPSGLFSYNTNKIQSVPTPLSSSRDQESFYQTLFQKFNPNPTSNLVLTHNSSNKQQPQSSIDTVAAAAKAITSDPSFQSVLTAALSSLISANNNANNSGIVNVGASAIDPNVRICHTSEIPNIVNWGKQSSSTTPNLLQPTNDGGAKGNINRCASSLLSMASNNTTNAQAGNLMVLSSPLPFSASSKSTSSSPGDSRDNSN